MKIWKAILVTVGIIVLSILVSDLSTPELGKAFAGLIVFASAIFISIDAKKIHPEKYNSKLGFDSNSLFILTILFWIIIFPGYLGLRYKIKNNLVSLRDSVDLKENPSQSNKKKPNTKLAIILIVLFVIVFFSLMAFRIISINK